MIKEKFLKGLREGGAPFIERPPDRLDWEWAWNALKSSRYVGQHLGVRLIAKATKEDTAKMSDIVKGALHADQIDDMRLMLSRARDGSVVHGAATASALTAKAAPLAA